MSLTIVFNLLKEMLLAMVMKVAWKAVAERFFTRLVIFGLNKLKDYSTNDVVDETVADITASLSGKGLTVIDNTTKNQL